MTTEPKRIEDSTIKLLLGADPEFFLYDKTLGTIVSAHDKVPGDKKNPFKVKKGAVQADGLAVEFNIDPASTAEEFAENIETVLSELRKMIPKRYSFEFVPIHEFDKNLFDKIPAYAKELGCDPDFSAYEIKHNKIPRDIGSIRTTSGHLHFGWTSKEDTTPGTPHFNDCVTLVRNLDSILERQRYLWDKNSQRQKYYGAPGAFRAKPYGVEYRVLSCAWLKYPNLWPWLFKQSNCLFSKTLIGYSFQHDPLVRMVSNNLINFNYEQRSYGFPLLPKKPLEERKWD